MIERDITLLKAGYCTHQEKVALKTKGLKTVKFPALFALIRLSEENYILFDTGYSDSFKEETRKFPFNIYAKITPVFFNSNESAKKQIEKLGVPISYIKTVFISHFHADHISGLNDFPNAKFICSKRAYNSIENTKGIPALLKAFIPNLIPKNFLERNTFIEESPLLLETQNSTLIKLKDTFGEIYDILGDGSILSMDLSGHAEGQFGLFLKTKEKYVFLVADAVWRSESFKEDIKPLFLAKIIMSNSEEYEVNFNKIVDFHKLEPNVFIVPSHCEDVF